MTNIVLGIMLDHELSKLNKVIDYKINHGISYKQKKITCVSLKYISAKLFAIV